MTRCTAFAPQSFDVVGSSLVLFFLPDPLGALRTWRELLVPDGSVGVSTFGPYSPSWRDDVDAVLRKYTPAGATDARTTWQQGPFDSDAGTDALLRDAGFVGVRTVTSTVSPRFDDPEHWYRWSRSVAQRQSWETIPDDDHPAVKADVYAVVDECRDERGRIGFDQQVRYTLGAR